MGISKTSNMVITSSAESGTVEAAAGGFGTDESGSVNISLDFFIAPEAAAGTEGNYAVVVDGVSLRAEDIEGASPSLDGRSVVLKIKESVAAVADNAETTDVDESFAGYTITSDSEIMVSYQGKVVGVADDTGTDEVDESAVFLSPVSVGASDVVSSLEISRIYAEDNDNSDGTTPDRIFVEFSSRLSDADGNLLDKVTESGKEVVLRLTDGTLSKDVALVSGGSGNTSGAAMIAEDGRTLIIETSQDLSDAVGDGADDVAGNDDDEKATGFILQFGKAVVSFSADPAANYSVGTVTDISDIYGNALETVTSEAEILKNGTDPASDTTDAEKQTAPVSEAVVLASANDKSFS